MPKGHCPRRRICREPLVVLRRCPVRVPDTRQNRRDGYVRRRPGNRGKRGNTDGFAPAVASQAGAGGLRRLRGTDSHGPRRGGGAASRQRSPSPRPRQSGQRPSSAWARRSRFASASPSPRQSRLGPAVPPRQSGFGPPLPSRSWRTAAARQAAARTRACCARHHSPAAVSRRNNGAVGPQRRRRGGGPADVSRRGTGLAMWTRRPPNGRRGACYRERTSPFGSPGAGFTATDCAKRECPPEP